MKRPARTLAPAAAPAAAGSSSANSMRSPSAAGSGSPFLLLALLVLHPIGVSGFAPAGPLPITNHVRHRQGTCGSGSSSSSSSSSIRWPLSAAASSDGVDDDDDDDDDDGGESSQPSSGIIEEMLSPTNEAYSRYTHLVAVPLETNHDLLLELESVQRAVLYNCPLLINACITPELTRMPLLYVDASGGRGEEASAAAAADLLGGRDIFSIMRNGGTSSTGTSSNSGDDASSGAGYHDPITAELHSIVEDVINEQIYSTETEDEEAEPILMSFKGLEMDGEANEVLHTIGTEVSPGTATLRLVLEEIRRRFEAKGWATALPPDEPQGGVPSTNTDDDNADDDNEGGQWRPRVPFMRLPANFEESLPPPKGTDGKYESYSDEEKARYVRQPEEGGNGISPIFWYRWWEDDLPAETVDDQGIRLREVAVYERTAAFGGTENAFYLPHMKVDLPGAGKALGKKEKQDAQDAMQRFKEKEEAFGGPDDSGGLDFDKLKDMVLGEDESAADVDGEDQFAYEETDRRMMEALAEGGILWEGTKSGDEGTFDKAGALDEDGTSFDRGALDVPRFDSIDDEMRAARTDAERRLVQNMYDSSPSDTGTGAEFIDVESVKNPDTTAREPAKAAVTSEEDFAVAAARAAVEQRRGDGSRIDPEESDSMSSEDVASSDEAKKREIVDKIRKPIATGDWSSAKPKDKMPWQENPVFKDWKSRVTMAEEEDGPAVETKPLPPFPSHEHFVGAWRMVSSPTSTFDGAELFGEDSSMSENLILRVDGLTAGGPILDMENMQRAAGGTWKFFEAQRIQGPDEDKSGDEKVERQTRLRVRLVVPPKKDRILCMEGHAQLIEASAVGSKNIDASSMMAPGTFGIPQAEAAKEKADKARAEKTRGTSMSSEEEANEDILRCSGEVWIEDARTGDNRKKLGRFVMEKKRVSDPSKLIYTIPKPTRIQD